MKPHTPGCLCTTCIETIADKARAFYEANREGMQNLEAQGFPFVKGLRELAEEAGA